MVKMAKDCILGIVSGMILSVGPSSAWTIVKVDWICCFSGAPHRINGKVSGDLRVGHTPVHFTDVDLHAYIVSNDGRAYTAISHIPQPAAQALLPLTPIGGLFGWLFALEKPGWENGFSLTGE